MANTCCRSYANWSTPNERRPNVAYHVVLVAGSPSKSSRSSRVLEAVATQLQSDGILVRLYSLEDFEPAVLLRGDTSNSQVQAFINDVQTARGIAVATPVYKGTFAGTLKVILDVIPPDALSGKVALGVATARLSDHLLGAAAGLRGIFDFFGIQRQVPPLLLTDDVLTDPRDNHALSVTALRAVRESASSVQARLD